MNQELPEKLYRFMGFRPEHKKQEIENVITKSKIKTVKPSRFNDPFDCFPHVDFSNHKKEKKKVVKEKLKERYPQITDDYIDNLANKELSNPQRQEMLVERTKNHLLPLIREKSGLICLAEKIDDIRMWSLYGDSHKGICLEFNRAHPDSIFNCAVKVDYSKCYPIITPLDNDASLAQKVFLTKAKFWKYENEWRIVAYKQGENEIEFKPEFLTGIIFGVNIELPHEKMIVNWVEKTGREIKLYKAKLKTAKFELDILPFTF